MPTVNIVIPTYNRAHQIGDAIEAALGQSHSPTKVTIVDDGSTDNTLEVLARYLGHPQVRCIALETNLGTAQAKNVAIAFNDCEFISFHDSDDIPSPDKIARQVAVAVADGIEANPVLNWRLVGTTPGARLSVDLVVNEHVLVTGDGTRHHMRRALSLVDDVFPNLQMAAGVPGDWILINCGLFRASVFEQLGGFRNCIEEDRELRNRLIFDGRVVWLIPHILMTKYECEDSLTVVATTDYVSDRRCSERQQIWQEAEAYRRGRLPEPVPIHFEHLRFRFLSQGLAVGSALLTEQARFICERARSKSVTSAAATTNTRPGAACSA